MAMNKGTVSQIMGPVLDIRFPDGQLPELLSAIEIRNGETTVVAEVAQHIGDNVVRCIAMSSTDGLQRGIEAIDTGAPISVPVGEECLGRVFNLLGQTIDEGNQVADAERWPIHRSAPAYDEQEAATEILETGIKVVDLICPYAKGGKIGLFGGAGVGKQSGGDGISAKLFQILKDDSVKVLHSICQQIWKTQQWPQDW